MRRAGRKDFVQAQIVSALRAIGVTVRVVNQEGLPDLLVHSRGIWRVVECKQPGEPLTDAQQRLYDEAPYPIVHSIAEALALFDVLR